MSLANVLETFLLYGKGGCGEQKKTSDPAPIKKEEAQEEKTEALFLCDDGRKQNKKKWGRRVKVKPSAIVPVVKRPRGRPRRDSVETVVVSAVKEPSIIEKKKKKKNVPQTRVKKKATLLPGYFTASSKPKESLCLKLSDDDEEDDDEEVDPSFRPGRVAMLTKKLEPSPKQQQEKRGASTTTTTMADFFQPRPLKLGPDGEPMSKCVPRYGRIYKRKPSDRVREKDRGQLKTAPGMRLCRKCQCLQPIEKFYTNVKRYICKYHHYQMVLKRKQIRFGMCSYEQVAWEAWVQLHNVCPLLGYTHVNYDRHDMMDLMMKVGIPTFCSPRVLPIDPRIPMRPRNVAIVTEASFILIKHLLKQTMSIAQFILLVQACNLLPENADVGTPWAPFHNAAYKRQDIDVVPILEAEQACPRKERLMTDAMHYAKENLQLIVDLSRSRKQGSVMNVEGAVNSKASVRHEARRLMSQSALEAKQKKKAAAAAAYAVAA
jgi:hypothetical protein